MQTIFMLYWVLFIVGGGFYVALEFFWRGFSHVSMFFAGGACLVLLSGVAARFSQLPLLVLCLFGTLIITSVEFITGAIVNVRLGLGVWDYSNLPLNVYGQVCARYSLLWFALSAPALFVIQLVNAL